VSDCSQEQVETTGVDWVLVPRVEVDELIADSITTFLATENGQRAAREARYRVQHPSIDRATAERIVRIAEIDAMIEARRLARPHPPPMTEEYRRKETEAFLDLLRKKERKGSIT
jgi:hypothetical protein